MSRSDLEMLMTTLEVDVVRLTECLVSPGWRLSLPASDLPAIHYNLAGIGQMVVGAALLRLMPSGSALREGSSRAARCLPVHSLAGSLAWHRMATTRTEEAAEIRRRKTAITRRIRKEVLAELGIDRLPKRGERINGVRRQP